MGQNSQEIAYGFGQLGSGFSDEAVEMKPPTGKVIVAIQFLSDTILSTLVAETQDNTAFFSHTVADTSAALLNGTGAAETDTATIFPKGLVIYGRWTSVTPPVSTDGGIICYYGY